MSDEISITTSKLNPKSNKKKNFYANIPYISKNCNKEFSVNEALQLFKSKKDMIYNEMRIKATQKRIQDKLMGITNSNVTNDLLFANENNRKKTNIIINDSMSGLLSGEFSGHEFDNTDISKCLSYSNINTNGLLEENTIINSSQKNKENNYKVIINESNDESSEDLIPRRRKNRIKTSSNGKKKKNQNYYSDTESENELYINKYVLDKEIADKEQLDYLKFKYYDKEGDRYIDADYKDTNSDSDDALLTSVLDPIVKEDEMNEDFVCGIETKNELQKEKGLEFNFNKTTIKKKLEEKEDCDKFVFKTKK